MYGAMVNSSGGTKSLDVSRIPICIALLAVLPFSAAILPKLPVLSAVSSSVWSADKPIFGMVFWGGLVPLYNAVLDYLSVAITRTCISSYLSGSMGWVKFCILDLGSTILLAVLACAGTIKLLFIMQGLGWAVNAVLVEGQVIRDPWGTQTLWITLSAVTNLLPALLHIVLLLWGLLTAHFLRDRSVVDSLLERLAARKPLNLVDARVIVRYVLVDRYLALAVVLICTCCVVYAAVPWLMSYLV